jgi:peptidoglycan/LPS O-acetylase OafA/YrhL/lysophospholipase L1-like esterase
VNPPTELHEGHPDLHDGLHHLVERIEAPPVPNRLPEFPYRPSLDGIRALAVVAVLLYHANVFLLPGGFLGVDLFFVLSGYLITSLLIIEQEDKGRIDLRAFWLRRLRRLIPALFVLIGFVALYAWLWADPSQLERLRGDALAALFYVANWRFIFSGQSYFDQFSAPSPLRHTWSLAIEEQWYLFWPIVVSLSLKLTKGRTKAMAYWVVAAASLSALLMAVLFDPNKDPSRIYFGTDTRAQALLIGAALAFFLHRRHLSTAARQVLEVIGIGGALTCLAMAVFVKDSDGWMYHGGFALMAVAASAVITVCSQPEPSPLKTAFEWAPLVFLGKISYGLYLYHWPIYVLLTPDRLHIDGVALLTLRLAVTVAVSLASYHFVEMPVRRGKLRELPGRLNSKMVFAGVGVASIGLLFLATWGAPTGGTPLNTAGFADAKPGDLRVMVIGDSTANALGENFVADRHPGLAVLPKGFPGCGIATGQVQKPGEAPSPATCDDWASLWASAVNQNNPDLSIIMIGAWEGFDHVVDGKLLKVGTPEYQSFINGQFDQAVKVLTAKGGKVVLIVPPCYQPKRFDNKASAYTPERHHQVDQIFTDYGKKHTDKVTTIDLAGYLCPSGDYQASLNGVDLHRDGVHLNEAGAELVWTWMQPQLAKIKRRG